MSTGVTWAGLKPPRSPSPEHERPLAPSCHAVQTGQDSAEKVCNSATNSATPGKSSYAEAPAPAAPGLEERGGGIFGGDDSADGQSAAQFLRNQDDERVKMLEMERAGSLTPTAKVFMSMSFSRLFSGSAGSLASANNPSVPAAHSVPPAGGGSGRGGGGGGGGGGGTGFSSVVLPSSVTANINNVAKAITSVPAPISNIDSDAPWSWGGLRQRVGKGTARFKVPPAANPPVAVAGAVAAGGASSPRAVRGIGSGEATGAGARSRSVAIAPGAAAEQSGAKVYGGGVLPPGFVFENGRLRVMEEDEHTAHSTASTDSGTSRQGTGETSSAEKQRREMSSAGWAGRPNSPCRLRSPEKHRRTQSSDFQDAFDAIADEVRRSSTGTNGGGRYAGALTHGALSPTSSCADQQEALSHHSLRWHEEQNRESETRGEVFASGATASPARSLAPSLASDGIKSVDSENSIESMFARIKNRHRPGFSQYAAGADAHSVNGAIADEACAAGSAASPQVSFAAGSNARTGAAAAARPQLLGPFGGGSAQRGTSPFSGRSDSEEQKRIESMFQSLVGAAQG